VDLRAAELRKFGIKIKIQEQPFQLLALLLEHPGEVVTREEIRQALWPEHTFVDFDRSLNKAMTKLRSALGDSAENPRYVETIHRHGYRFLFPLAEGNGERRDRTSQTLRGAIAIPSRTEAAGPSVEIQAPESPLPAGTTLRTQKLWSSHLFLASTFLGACGVLVLGVYLWFAHSNPLGNSSSMVNPRRSVAVLGFRNLSGDPNEAWLSTALSDWLTTELSAGEQLRTLPAENIARMKMELGAPELDSLSRETLGRIGKNLGTDLVILGSYATLGEKEGGQIRLDLRLLDTRTGEVVDALSQTGSQANLFDLVSRSGEHLRSKLGVRSVTREEAAQVAFALPSNREAARLYSEGLAKLRVYDALAAHDLLAKSIAVEPDFALSHSALASAWARQGYDENAKAESKKAFDLSSPLSRAERLLVEGRYREATLNWEKAIEIYRALFDFFPDNLEYGIALATAQVSEGKGKEALVTVAALQALPSPLSDDPRVDLAEGNAAESLGDFKRMETATERAIRKAAASGDFLVVARAKLDQCWALENLGEFDKVQGVVEEAKQLFTAAHDQLGFANALTVRGIALEDQGDLLGAKKQYEASLAVYQVTGGRVSAASAYDNIGDILLYTGNLAGARRSYEDGLRIYREISRPGGVALIEAGLGEVYLAEGRLTEAREMFADSLTICQQIGDRSKEAAALSGMGRTLRLGGDLEGAHRMEEEARRVFAEIGDRAEEARQLIALADLSLDQDKVPEAIAATRRAANVFEQTKTVRDEAMADLIQAKALLMEGDRTEAGIHIERATQIAQTSHDRELELSARVMAARIQAASKSVGDVNEAIRRLDGVLAEANAGSLGVIALETRLAQGEIELNSRNYATGRAQLAALEKDANRGGLQLLVRAAAAALHVRRDQALRTQTQEQWVAAVK
jgi:tetratricopeptide (TPR) repeat protein/DNA-binding winged helix-turn-helix (wHTH) protein